jgi:hypothetical protein
MKNAMKNWVNNEQKSFIGIPVSNNSAHLAQHIATFFFQPEGRRTGGNGLISYAWGEMRCLDIRQQSGTQRPNILNFHKTKNSNAFRTPLTRALSLLFRPLTILKTPGQRKKILFDIQGEKQGMEPPHQRAAGVGDERNWGRSIQ